MKSLTLLWLLPLFGLSQQTIPFEIDSECNRRVENNINHGIAIATIDSLNRIKFYNYGYEGDGGIEISEQSILEIASISKTFTSELINNLAENNVIQLEQEIRKYIPDSLPEQVRAITFQQLINHTSGLPRLPLDYWASNWDNPYADYNEIRLLRDLMVVQLDSTKQWGYSNFGYMVLGYIVDHMNGNNSFNDLLSSIDLQNTYLSFNEISDLTTPHNFGHEVEHWEFPTITKYIGGIKTSCSDLIKYLLHRARYNPSFSKDYSSPDVVVNASDSIYCRNGWLLFRRNNQEIIWHNGVSGGFNVFVGYNIQSSSGVVVLSNSQSSITDIGLHYLSKSFELSRPKKPFINKLEYLVRNDSINGILKSWERCDTTIFDKSIGDVYWLQCHYISKKNLDAALALNSILLAELKDDWEAFYYRAKIYRSAGNFELARKYYQQADELFPENNFIKNELKGLPTKP